VGSGGVRPSDSEWGWNSVFCHHWNMNE
jgi:hypothetical protein